MTFQYKMAGIGALGGSIREVKAVQLASELPEAHTPLPAIVKPAGHLQLL